MLSRSVTRSLYRSGARLQSTSVKRDLFPLASEVNQEDLVGHNDFGSKKYFVERSRVGNIPVYTDYRGGGNKIVTEIRKIQGNAVQLKKDLQAKLPEIPEKNWRVIPQSNKIEIKGHYISELRRILGETF
ncbi:Large ribosomal subunit protein mL49 [Nakaseomyces bracarensis]|uniref:Large ribosomal subunit protein mL49 n=1 Tax=Nakaseomyces bracarensis TaxID=273131 RepID=A0ABR4NLZ3_9SACH